MKWVVGLGNPGPLYRKTRHNIGFEVVKAFAEELKASFVRKEKLLAEMALGEIDGVQVACLLPTTYMNESGQAVKRALKWKEGSPQKLLVIADDVDIPFGSLRIRTKGGTGGHNGLQSIEQEIGTQEYARLRFGVGGRMTEVLEDHVLSSFTDEEAKELPQIIERAVNGIKTWVLNGIEKAMLETNK